MAPKILVVLTSEDKIPKSGRAMGWYLPELAHPYEVLAPKAEITIASPKGGVAPLDPSSVEMFKSDEVCANFFATKKSLWENTRPLKEFVGRASEFDAIFYPGGHGPMFDLVDDKESIQLIREFYDSGKPVSAVCHGPIVFANVPGLLEGKTVTGFSNDEEDMVNLTAEMPFLLEDILRAKAASYVKADAPFGEKVVTDGLLITGQNPASGKAVAEAIATKLGI